MCIRDRRLHADVLLLLARPLRTSSITVELRGEATVAWKAQGHHVTGNGTGSATSAASSSGRAGQACQQY